jgi:hypothetical protein
MTIFRKTPSGSAVISAFLNTTSGRLEKYRETVRVARQSLEKAGIRRKEEMKGRAKSLFLSQLRSSVCADSIAWIDAAAVIREEKPTFSLVIRQRWRERWQHSFLRQFYAESMGDAAGVRLTACAGEAGSFQRRA